MSGLPGVAARLFSALAARDISVILITQASSECTITLCVQQADAAPASLAIEAAFDVEIAAGRVDTVQQWTDCAVLSIVGEGMRQRAGVAGTFLMALADIGCSVAAIAQGSSERSISTVIAARDAHRALCHVHHGFFATREVVALYLCRTGTVGSQFLRQLAHQQAQLPETPLELRLCGVMTSRAMLLNDQGIDPSTALELLAKATAAADLEGLYRHLRTTHPDQPVLVDCTSSPQLGLNDPQLLAAGLHLVTASKHANSASLQHYHAMRRTAARHCRQFRYETNVGGGLPVIATLQALRDGGDRVVAFSGILSGSQSFLMGLLEDGVAFSQAVRMAKAKGVTEPDPRDELSGTDVARKVLILPRESGCELELADVQVTGLLPPEFDSTGSVAALMDRLEAADGYFADLVAQAKRDGQVLRYLGEFDAAGCRVGLRSVAASDALAPVRAGENAFSFLTVHYHPQPLVVRGYGAGAAVTAAGVLADVLTIARGAGRRG